MVVALQSNNTQLTTAITKLHFPVIFYQSTCRVCDAGSEYIVWVSSAGHSMQLQSMSE